MDYEFITRAVRPQVEYDPRDDWDCPSDAGPPTPGRQDAGWDDPDEYDMGQRPDYETPRDGH
jgi:hypothetical protein